jgi:hypothetical protein
MGKTRTAVDQIFNAPASGQMGRQCRTGDCVFTNTACGSDTLDDVIPHMHALFQDRFEWGPVQKFVG